MLFTRIVLGVCVVALCAACSKPPRKITLEKDYSRQLPPGQKALRKITDPAMIPYFGDALRDKESLIAAIDYSLDYFNHPSTVKYYPYLPEITHAKAVASLQQFKVIFQQAQSGQELQKLILDKFDVYQSVGCDDVGTVLFTGYCEPIYDGGLTQTAECKYPLYKMPPDLVKDPEGKCLGRKTADGTILPYYTREEIDRDGMLKGQVYKMPPDLVKDPEGKCLGRKTADGTILPYYTREEINRDGMLKGQGLELVWLKSKLEAYIVHVQGSARIRLSDGSEYRVGYAAKNDKPYNSVGEALVREGKIPQKELSLRRLKEYFAQHPEDVDKYLSRNPCYVFFRHTTGGPFGSLGQPVTPYRSIATDKDIFPRGCLAYVETALPSGGAGSLAGAPFKTFLLDQDTGGAIRSAGRCDIFMGTGPDAELLAGRTRNEGKLYYLFLKEGKDAPAVSIALQH